MKLVLLVLIFTFSENTYATQAQPVPIPEDQSLTPQINISGVGIGTLGISRFGENQGKTKTGMNLSDSGLLFGAAQRLTDGAIGSSGLGFITLDQSNKGLGTQLFLHQAFVNYQSEKLEILIGRSDNPTAHLVDFPTLRGDDLVTLANPLNPYANGENSEEHRYSNVSSITLNQELKYFESFRVQHLISSANSTADAGINSWGATFQYLGAPGLEAFQKIPSFGFSYEHYLLNSGGSHGLHQLSLGGILNLNTSVTHRFELGFQNILSLGSNLKTFQNITDSYQADSNNVTASLRYLVSPFGMLGYQLALTGGFKNYFKVLGEKSYGGGFTAVKRLGQGFDVALQYLGQWRSSQLAQVQSGHIAYEQSLELGLIFNFDATINAHLVPRRTLLNQQFHYLSN